MLVEKNEIHEYFWEIYYVFTNQMNHRIGSRAKAEVDIEAG